MAVLVTGGAGFIGSVTTERLLAAGEEVVVFDDFSTGHRDAIPREVRLFEGNTLDQSALRTVFREASIDTVLHFAAFIQVGESCQDPSKYFKNNVAGSQSVLDVMREMGVSYFVLSSTAAVYGNPETVPITEDAPCRPVNPYGLSKRMVEQILEWYDVAYGMRYVALRYFNAAGASIQRGEDHHPETHLIPNVLAAAVDSRKAVTVFGQDYDTPDGTCIRDYIHVEDLADAHVAAVRYLRKGGGSNAFNLGTENGVSVLEVIDSVRRVTGRELRVEYSGRRAGDAERLVASSEKARRILGWTPAKSDIDTIVRDAWEWRKKHPNGYAR
ncbi:MAG TPA: UDP-glucose 4-epimerase GalE [Candidatus Hydrogenedentes bacterium]|nr:UDP-glucose 4-epimerase GalE [Candidatus Hydrogenedentota bacterium]HOL78230.1 UDP-glucose 4-epimerase GalE [Candidatus Hydrogenedentota bacterium]HPO84535.1 UDP-glucose 4-epimerase GalE [Candidatus Hydrogenedentota bacterium]